MSGQQAIGCRNCRESDEMESRSRWGSDRGRYFSGGHYCENGVRGGVGASRNIIRYRVNTIYRVLSLHQPTRSICCVSGRINTTEIITSIQIHIFSVVYILCSLGLVVVLLLTNDILNTADLRGPVEMAAYAWHMVDMSRSTP